eukprot:GHVN01032109.1.p1 GENE.GHVN01032109.1~~GHVN01032109.1.p1  ORF type:complete len:406 (+),score=93.84 GHVN01032109.1:66-1283(+)
MDEEESKDRGEITATDTTSVPASDISAGYHANEMNSGSGFPEEDFKTEGCAFQFTQPDSTNNTASDQSVPKDDGLGAVAGKKGAYSPMDLGSDGSHSPVKSGEYIGEEKQDKGPFMGKDENLGQPASDSIPEITPSPRNSNGTIQSSNQAGDKDPSPSTLTSSCCAIKANEEIAKESPSPIQEEGELELEKKKIEEIQISSRSTIINITERLYSVNDFLRIKIKKCNQIKPKCSVFLTNRTTTPLLGGQIPQRRTDDFEVLPLMEAITTNIAENRPPQSRAFDNGIPLLYGRGGRGGAPRGHISQVMYGRGGGGERGGHGGERGGHGGERGGHGGERGGHGGERGGHGGERGERGGYLHYGDDKGRGRVDDERFDQLNGGKRGEEIDEWNRSRRGQIPDRRSKGR